MKCPHCNHGISHNREPNLSKAMTNVENYDSSTFYFKCPKCGKKYGVYIERVVKVKIDTVRKMPDDKDLSYG